MEHTIEIRLYTYSELKVSTWCVVEDETKMCSLKAELNSHF